VEFARNIRTGRVHILAWTPGPHDDGFDPRPVTFAEGLAEMMTTRRRMLCPVSMLLLPGGRGEHVGGSAFADEELCISCVKALGSEQWRAFHKDNRGEPL
jgi:hypothetical protein